MGRVPEVAASSWVSDNIESFHVRSLLLELGNMDGLDLLLCTHPVVNNSGNTIRSASLACQAVVRDQVLGLGFENF